MDFLFSRIQNKLMVAFVLVLFIPLLVVGLYSYQTTRSTLINAQIEKEITQSESQAKVVSSFLENVMNETLFLSQSEYLQALLAVRLSGSSEATEKALDNIVDYFKYFAVNAGIYQQVRYIDEKGMEVVKIHNVRNVMKKAPENELENEANRYYFQEAMKLEESQVHVSNLDLSTVKGEIEKPYKPVIRYATPVFYKNGKRAGIVILNALANYFLGAVASGPDEEGERYLVDEDEGNFFVHPDESKQWGRDLKTGIALKTELPHVAAAVEQLGHEGVIQTPKELIYLRRIVPSGQTKTHWRFISVDPLEEIMKPAQQFTYTFILLSLIALLGAGLLAVFMARGISTPVMHLSNVSDQISQGDLDVEIKVTSKDEIGQLAESLERMRASLQAAIARLRKKRT